jgi:hypothetical protein
VFWFGLCILVLALFYLFKSSSGYLTFIKSAKHLKRLKFI